MNIFTLSGTGGNILTMSENRYVHLHSVWDWWELVVSDICIA